MQGVMASDVMCLCVFLLCAGLQYTTGCEVVSGFVICSAGESVLLSCRDINSGHTEVQWWYSDSKINTPQYSVFPVDAVKGQRYKDRVQILRNLSLSITRLSVEDTGIYWCKTTETDKERFVQLFIEGCSLSGNEGSVEISRYSGQSVFLSCSVKCSARHEPDSKFRWKLPNYREINHTINPTERRLYQGRLHMFDISSGNLSLLISNLTEEDEGLYSCWSNENQHKNFSLTVKGCTLSETEREPETKYTGDSVLLSCSCEDPNTKPEDFRWTHVESSGTEVSSETPRYKDRVHTFHKTTPSNLSLLISNLTEDDQGTYRCTVNHKTSADTRLIVKGCTLSETEREPETKYTGDSVLLSCSCEDPNSKPEDFRWTHVESSGTEVSSETPRYKDRVHTFHKTTPSNLSLLISNLTEDDQGTYRCTVNHKTSADTRLIVKGETVVLELTQSLNDSVCLGN
uniref:Ig-like domain-containing protein n=1 Tax=Cyprinus carpio carpio TaxID=630221 RepID=A0A9J8B0A4_CYPCA